MNTNTETTSYVRRTTLLMWVGFVFVVVPEVLFFPGEPDEKITRIEYEYTPDPNTGALTAKARTTDISPPNPMVPYCLAINFAGWAFWLYCIYRTHRSLGEATNKAYPIMPAKAVWGHLIPLYNLFWVFRWTSVLAGHLNEAMNRKKGKWWPGILLCIAFLYAYLSSVPARPSVGGHAVALAISLFIGIYFSRTLEQVELARNQTASRSPDNAAQS